MNNLGVFLAKSGILTNICEHGQKTMMNRIIKFSPNGEYRVETYQKNNQPGILVTNVVYEQELSFFHISEVELIGFSTSSFTSFMVIAQGEILTYKHVPAQKRSNDQFVLDEIKKMVSVKCNVKDYFRCDTSEGFLLLDYNRKNIFEYKFQPKKLYINKEKLIWNVHEITWTFSRAKKN